MTPTEMRTELLAQHSVLREKMKAARASADECTSQPLLPALKKELKQLADAVRMHNLREEQLLMTILPTIDAWGEVRTLAMLEQHTHEHEELYEALLAVSTCEDPRAAVSAVNQLLDRLAQHMEQEEGAHLAAEVLNDDAVTPDSFGG